MVALAARKPDDHRDRSWPDQSNCRTPWGRVRGERLLQQIQGWSAQLPKTLWPCQRGTLYGTARQTPPLRPRGLTVRESASAVHLVSGRIGQKASGRGRCPATRRL